MFSHRSLPLLGPGLLAALLLATSAASQATTEEHHPSYRPGQAGAEGPRRYEEVPLSPNLPPVRPPANAAPGTSPPGFLNRALSFDCRTRVETRLPVPTGTLPGSAETKGSVPPFQEGEPESFGSLSAITSSAFPWSPQCRIVIHVGTKASVGSATIIDERHAITAGHCVHTGKGGQWVDRITLLPAWDGDDDAYGQAQSTQLLAWTAWTNNSDFNHDIAVIRFDRPLGFLTQKLGYGYSTSNSFYTGNTFNIAGYPAHTSYPGGPNQLFYAAGKYDKATSYRADAATNWPYFPGGMSGSGIYYISGSNRIVHLVQSTGSDPWGTNKNIGCTRLTASKYVSVAGSFIPGGYTTKGLDLLPLAVQVTTPTAGTRAGERLTKMSYTVANASLYDPPSAKYNVDVYLSKDDNISPLDTKIQSHAFTWDFGPRSKVVVTVSTPPTIPLATTPGNYHVGIILTLADQDPSNNQSDGWDAAAVKVAPLRQVIPLGYAGKEGDSSVTAPCRYAPSRGMFIYSSKVLPPCSMTLESFKIRANGGGKYTGGHTHRLQISMSTRSQAPAQTYSLEWARNHGSDLTVVMAPTYVRWPSTPGSAIHPFLVTFNLKKPFAIKTGRTLVVDFLTLASSFTSDTYYLDAQSSSGWSLPNTAGVTYSGQGCPQDFYHYSTSLYPGHPMLFSGYCRIPKATPVAVFLGLSKTAWGAFRLPIYLGPLGAAGCNLYTEVGLALPGLSDARSSSGRYEVYAGLLAMDPAMAGAMLYSQTAALDPGFNSLGLRFSRLAESRIGNVGFSGSCNTLHLYSYGSTGDHLWTGKEPAARYYNGNGLILELQD